ncbi:MAG: deoxyhypusine synthase [Candidatus Bathyarchaeia archaeon]|nr:deoxyhypusine synthase [Candidatus Bathyarchaeota archaeon]
MIKEKRETPYFKRKLEPIEVKVPKKISELLSEMAKTGFQGRKLGEVVEVWKEMLEDDVTIFMGYAGSMSTTGQWKIIRWLIENRFVDVLVSTGANISEDILEAMGGTYWQGSPWVDDHELLKYRIDRFYDVFADEYEYRQMESLIADFMKTLDQNRRYSSAEFLHLFGKHLSELGIKSIVAAAYENNVPVFCPAIVDSGYGIAYLQNKYDNRNFNLIIDQMKDFEQLVEIKTRARDTGVIYIGGGVPKDFIQLTAVGACLLSLKSSGSEEIYPHKYAIQITTDAPHWGGLSGCTFEEAISWGKEAIGGRNVQCFCDATIALPIVVHALAERVNKREKAPDLSWLFNSL